MVSSFIFPPAHSQHCTKGHKLFGSKRQPCHCLPTPSQGQHALPSPSLCSPRSGFDLSQQWWEEAFRLCHPFLSHLPAVTRFLVSSAESPGAWVQGCLTGVPSLQGFAGNQSALFARICREQGGRTLQDPPDLEGAFSLSGSIGSVRQKGCTGVRDTKIPHFPPALLRGWKSRLGVGI